ncbi:MAG TPA: hypothetical protein VMT85_11610 [Thermoanaerobaculia bacterium]|nr:hypothetical protein [Thermoanaerobaculia bacterium]
MRLSVIGLSLLLAASIAPAANLDLGPTAQTGQPPLQSVGPIAFGPDGVLFVADAESAAVFAIETGDTEAATSTSYLVEGLDAKLAAVLGASSDSVVIHDLAVNPASGRAYLSITRGAGDDATPVLARVEPGGEISVLELEQVRYAKAELPNPVGEEAKDRRGRPLRQEAITDIAYSDGKLLVTGLSNEEFSSNLRTLQFPFDGVGKGASIEVYHGAHGQWETHAPVRTMTTIEIDDQSHVLAAYTCTPLVTFPVDELTDGTKVTGSTVAELGNRNRPLDMFVYAKDGKDWLLIANSSRGVMKVDLASLGPQRKAPITEPIEDTAGLEYETIASLTGIEQLDRLGSEHALVLERGDSGVKLRSIALP